MTENPVEDPHLLPEVDVVEAQVENKQPGRFGQTIGDALGYAEVPLGWHAAETGVRKVGRFLRGLKNSLSGEARRGLELERNAEHDQMMAAALAKSEQIATFAAMTPEQARVALRSRTVHTALKSNRALKRDMRRTEAEESGRFVNLVRGASERIRKYVFDEYDRNQLLHADVVEGQPTPSIEPSIVEAGSLQLDLFDGTQAEEPLTHDGDRDNEAEQRLARAKRSAAVLIETAIKDAGLLTEGDRQGGEGRRFGKKLFGDKSMYSRYGLQKKEGEAAEGEFEYDVDSDRGNTIAQELSRAFANHEDALQAVKAKHAEYRALLTKSRVEGGVSVQAVRTAGEALEVLHRELVASEELLRLNIKTVQSRIMGQRGRMIARQAIEGVGLAAAGAGAAAAVAGVAYLGWENREMIVMAGKAVWEGGAYLVGLAAQHPVESASIAGGLLGLGGATYAQKKLDWIDATKIAAHRAVGGVSSIGARVMGGIAATAASASQRLAGDTERQQAYVQDATRNTSTPLVPGRETLVAQAERTREEQEIVRDQALTALRNVMRELVLVDRGTAAYEQRQAVAVSAFDEFVVAASRVSTTKRGMVKANAEAAKQCIADLIQQLADSQITAVERAALASQLVSRYHMERPLATDIADQAAMGLGGLTRLEPSTTVELPTRDEVIAENAAWLASIEVQVAALPDAQRQAARVRLERDLQVRYTQQGPEVGRLVTGRDGARVAEPTSSQIEILRLREEHAGAVGAGRADDIVLEAAFMKQVLDDKKRAAFDDEAAAIYKNRLLHLAKQTLQPLIDQAQSILEENLKLGSAPLDDPAYGPKLKNLLDAMDSQLGLAGQKGAYESSYDALISDLSLQSGLSESDLKSRVQLRNEVQRAATEKHKQIGHLSKTKAEHDVRIEAGSAVQALELLRTTISLDADPTETERDRYVAAIVEIYRIVKAYDDLNRSAEGDSLLRLIRTDEQAALFQRIRTRFTPLNGLIIESCRDQGIDAKAMLDRLKAQTPPTASAAPAS